MGREDSDARHLGVAWDTCWAAIKNAASARIADPARWGNINTIGVDEHVWRPSKIASTDKGGHGDGRPHA
ncbi:MAG: hypothetical protein ACSLFD_03720 [Solirubrobacterales bacterium]